MKTLSKIILITLVSAGFSQAATTVSTANFSSLSNGIPVLDAAGVPLSGANRSWSVGYFSNGFDFATATAATIITNFTTFGTTNTNFAFNGGVSSSEVVALPANDATFTGKTIHILYGNAASVVGSTAFAVLTANTLFPTVDGAANGAASATTLAPGNVVFGRVLTSGNFTQPAGGTFASGVQVLTVAIPEPSAVLLGAVGFLGLLRRRRN